MIKEQKNANILNIMLWTAQVVLAATFLWAGVMKLVQPDALPFPWIKESSHLVLITGLIDLLAGLGIVFPLWLSIKPKLTIFAAYGIFVLMMAACIFHISRGEAGDIGFNIFMAFLAVFVAWGRQSKRKISTKV
ncbi:DoxX family protein [Anditalea andensis]|uniref:Membrane protein n=1 Tax=Anditalea andensis TaxID=1048983 RepID=A0A074KVC1_9BACT|nr:DoxX family protein [Anditalea andensis]KEO73931.1 membrane protein [Anditalea andensis]